MTAPVLRRTDPPPPPVLAGRVEPLGAVLASIGRRVVDEWAPSHGTYLGVTGWWWVDDRSPFAAERRPTVRMTAAEAALFEARR